MPCAGCSRTKDETDTVPVLRLLTLSIKKEKKQLMRDTDQWDVVGPESRSPHGAPNPDWWWGKEGRSQKGVGEDSMEEVMIA